MWTQPYDRKQLFILDDIQTVLDIHNPYWQAIYLWTMVHLYEPDKGSFAHGEHTADIWLIASGTSIEEVIGKMLVGLYGTISEAYSYEEDLGPLEIHFTGRAYEDLLIDALSEALFLLVSENVLFDDLEVDLEGTEVNGQLTLTLRCSKRRVTIVPERQGMEVKAVTRYETSLKPLGGRWTARVLLDI
jgi:SHS2 domain-containing protein